MSDEEIKTVIDGLIKKCPRIKGYSIKRIFLQKRMIALKIRCLISGNKFTYRYRLEVIDEAIFIYRKDHTFYWECFDEDTLKATMKAAMKAVFSDVYDQVDSDSIEIKGEILTKYFLRCLKK